MEKGRTQNLHFWSDFEPLFPPEDGQNQKLLAALRKNISHWAIKICQNQGSISSPLSGKNKITFCTIWAVFDRRQDRVTSQMVIIKLRHNLFHSHDSWSNSCKKILFPTLSIFAVVGHKRHLRKLLT